MKKLFVSPVLMIFIIGMVSAGPGAIWTTKSDCGNSTQDANEYAVGEKVYINGNNFDAGTYAWDITGQPSSCDDGAVVASDKLVIDASGAFCFAAYTVQDDDCGVYKADVTGKHDNYHVTLSTEPPTTVPETALAVGLIALLTPGMIYLARKRE